jgi:hypothetical protein
MTVPQLETAARRLVWDDFGGGLAVYGPRARWSYQTAGPHVADDAVATATPDGLRVVASGTNPRTGEPAFTRTLAPEPENPAGLPGTLDHTKWMVHSTHIASTGLPGFDAEPGRLLTFETTVSARTYGTAGHPFAEHVADPDADMRLAVAAVNCYDPRSLLVFDFFLTNSQIYAIYERLPFARPALGHYAAFTYAVPVARRAHDERHALAISNDRAAGVMRWLIGGSEVFRVDRLGRYLESRQYLVIDHGGTEAPVEPAQINCGLSLFTMLDCCPPGQGGPGLVRISAAGGYYFDPGAGAPHPQRFADEFSLAANRLFGQGAELVVSDMVVSDSPTGC